MGLDFLTVLMIVFVFLMYIYLYLVRATILIKEGERWLVKVFIFVVAFALFFVAFTTFETADQFVRYILAAFLFLSLTLESGGLTDDRIITTPFYKSGALYIDIEKIILLKKSNEIQMSYFKNGRRGPLITFIVPLEEMIPFLAKRLNKETELSIIIDEETNK